MFSGLAALLVVAVVLVALYGYATGPGRRVVALFDRYRPHAPMADWSLGAADRPGRTRDLAIVRDRQACGARDRSAPGPTAAP
ncbi:hypothetical protein C5E45_21590 [Nocardia nova]|uniref:Uncharacterized protein n=1 Tax=Nocardia nova TaxID=37330 RepID=A0A2S6AM82_9NOCA|nr:hypothetical protein C5E41_06080 [Nocardia nova]PPJ36303.1 hypothetical protein C5E45_21590 [Nocardia nova]